MQKFLSVSTYIIVALFIKIKSVLYKLPIYISDYHKFKSLKPGDIICGQWMVVSNIFNSNIRLCIRINKKYNYQYPMLFMSFKTYVNLYTTNNHPRIRRNHMNSAYIATLLSAQAQSWNFIEFHTEFLRT